MKLSAKLGGIGYFMESFWAVCCSMDLFVKFGFGYKNKMNIIYVTIL